MCTAYGLRADGLRPYGGLRRPTAAYGGLRRPTAAYGGLRRPTAAYGSLTAAASVGLTAASGSLRRCLRQQATGKLDVQRRLRRQKGLRPCLRRPVLGR